jgi:hypothetical protein
MINKCIIIDLVVCDMGIDRTLVTIRDIYWCASPITRY